MNFGNSVAHESGLGIAIRCVPYFFKREALGRYFRFFFFSIFLKQILMNRVRKR